MFFLKIVFVLLVYLVDKNINYLIITYMYMFVTQSDYEPPSLSFVTGAMLCTARGLVDDPLLNLSSF